jgi:DNA-binding transcriptional LysR family regulator
LFAELVTPALRALRKNWPDLRFHLFRIRRQGLFNDLFEDTIDCAFRHYRQGASNWLAISYGQIKGFFASLALRSNPTEQRKASPTA